MNESGTENFSDVSELFRLIVKDVDVKYEMSAEKILVAPAKLLGRCAYGLGRFCYGLLGKSTENS